jgi:hypothetical protein
MEILALPPLSLLNELFEISETSPSGLRWKEPPKHSSVKTGDVAGTKWKRGYWRVTITTDKKRIYAAHRIVYTLQTGVDPGESQVDHIIGVEEPLKLRLATAAQNHANRKLNVGSSSQYKGVCWYKNNKKWKAAIMVNRKTIHLGYFADEQSAAAAYNAAAVKYFGEFARLNTF